MISDHHGFFNIDCKKIFNYECRDDIFDMIDKQNIFQYTTEHCGKGPVLTLYSDYCLVFYDKNKKRKFTKDDLYCVNCKEVMHPFVRRFILSETSICYNCFIVYILSYFVKKYMLLLHAKQHFLDDIITNIALYFKELHKIKYNYIFLDTNDYLEPKTGTVTIITYGSLNYGTFINKHHTIFSKFPKLILPDEINRISDGERTILRWVILQLSLIINEIGEYIVLHILPKETKEIFKEFEKAIQYVEILQPVLANGLLV